MKTSVVENNPVRITVKMCMSVPLKARHAEHDLRRIHVLVQTLLDKGALLLLRV